MSVPVNYSLLTNFLNHVVNLDAFQREISLTAITQVPDSIQRSGDTVTVAFPLVLSAPDKTLLDGVVASHVGADFVATPIRVVSVAQQTNNTNTDTVAASIVIGVGGLAGAMYQVNFLCEIATTILDANSSVRLAVQFAADGVTFNDVYEDNWDRPLFHISGGSAIMTMQPSARPAIQLIFRKLGLTSNPAIIRRIRMSLQQLGT